MRQNRIVLLFAAVAILLVSCGTSRTVPITGRTQHLMVDNQQVLSLSNQQYQQYMKSAVPSTNATSTAMVKRCGQRLAAAVENYLRNNGMANELSEYSWEFNLVRDQNINAFCMPGGKIVVFEGLLPVTKDESSLAIVLGHEIAHAVAKHSAERMSSQVRQQYGVGIIGAVAQGAGVSSGVQKLGSVALGTGLQALNSGFSRSQESEADHLGLIFAAMAGYDPRVATDFWQRMAASTGGGSNSIFSDHPSDATRIKNIQGWMTEALRYYNPSGSVTSSAHPKVAEPKTVGEFRVSTKKRK